jgi:tRNA threonylcarbamoyladenosine biosynthesis protein TsaB
MRWIVLPSRLLVLETSHKVGVVALASGEAIVAERRLDEARRHARDLAPAIQELLQTQGWRARDLDAVIVSRGPGSYTGLRVGIMSAKTLAYAVGCPLIAVNTFDAIAARGFASARPQAANLDVIADAQQSNVYAQRFGAQPEPLLIVPFAMWLESALAWNVAVTGPGLETFGDRVPPGVNVLTRDLWHASPVSLLQIGLARLAQGERDDLYAVEPLYLRASSAEENWAKLKG